MKEAFVLFNDDKNDGAQASAMSREKYVRYSEHTTEGESPAEDQRNRCHTNRLNQ